MIVAMNRVTRRSVLGGLATAALTVPAIVRGEAFAGSWQLTPQPIGDGLWLVRGADEAITFANGGAIANAVILATRDAPGAILFDCGPSLGYARALSAVARQVTDGPVRQVFVSHLHPDHALGTAAFDPAIVAALPTTRQELERDGKGFADAMYRILADWMRGTEVVLPGASVSPGPLTIGGRALVAHALTGHSAGDLALTDVATGTLLAGDLVFHNRAPATPDADLAQWRTSLATLAALPHRQLVPGHGPLDPGGQAAIAQTRAWLDWLEPALARAAAQGLDMSEAGEIAIPPQFAEVKMARYELQRSVSHFWPRLETSALPRIDGPR